MNYKIIVSPIASKNIEDTVEYYIHKASKKLASDFLKEYRKTYKALQISPFYQFHDANYQFIPFDKFPYLAFFIVDEPSKTVFLNAVFHTSQKPGIVNNPLSSLVCDDIPALKTNQKKRCLFHFFVKLPFIFKNERKFLVFLTFI